MEEPEKSAVKAVCGEIAVVAELDEPLDPDPKTLKDESEGGLVENSRENGIRVSTNGKEGLDDRLGGIVVETDKTKVLETEISVGNVDMSGGEEAGLEDSEMNGVSSLLKMREDGERKGFGSFIDAVDKKEKGNEKEVPAGLTSSGNGVAFFVEVTGNMNSIADDESRDFNEKEDRNGDFEEMSERRDWQGDEMDDEGYEFHVGDFVWGKIRSHPWWAGQIYNSMDASDFALKVKQKGRLLVAYFGDGTFAWCHPSQLRPFEENFEEMSKMSNSKNFINAVQKALDEMGRQIELSLTCSCVPKENLNGIKRPLAENAGIREGIPVPEGGAQKLSESLFQPTQILAEMRHLAEGASVINSLECAVLKSQLSAFYGTQGGYKMPTFYEPHPISGLQEERNSGINRSLEYNTRDVAIQGPVEEDWLSSLIGHKFDKNCQSLLRQCSGVSEDGPYQRRKQKSIAEIMEGEKIVQPKKEVSGGKAVSLSVSKKRKGSIEADGNMSNASTSVPRRKKASERLGSHTATESAISSVENDGGGAKEKVVSGPSTRGRKRIKDSNLENDIGVSKEETYISPVYATKEGPSTRRRKKEGSSLGNDGAEGKTETSDNPVLTAKKKKRKKDNLRFQDDDGKANEQTERDHVPRERKKSRYLSPPYTDPNQSHLRSGERMSKSVDDLIESPPNLKASAEASHKKNFKDLGGHEKTDNLSPQPPKEDQNEAIDSSKVKAPVNKVVSKIRSVALGPQYVKEDSYINMVEDFLSAFRSSIYRNGSNYKLYNQSTRKRKLVVVDSEPESFGKDQNQAEQSSHECHAKRAKIKKSEKIKTAKTKCKQTSNGLDLKTNDLEIDGQGPCPELFVTFGPGSSLPSKNDLITIYEKYGPLDKEETGMFYNNFCGRVVFLRSSDATEAFKSSQSASPFGASKVTFRLRLNSAASKVRELKDIPNPKPSPRSKERDKIVPSSKEGGKTQNKLSGSRSSDGEGTQLGYIRQKLETMTSMLEKSDGKMSQEIKSKLEAEMKGLLKKVSTMVASSS